MSTQLSRPPDLESMIEHWVDADIITAVQADRIREDTARPAATRPPARGPSLVTEALAYLGGVIVLVGLGLVIGLFWADLSTTVRIVLAGAVAVLLSLAGTAVPAHLAAVGVRLRSVLWVASAVALFACLSLVGADAMHWDGNHVLLFAAAGTVVATAVMWAAHPHIAQHAAFFACLLILVGAAAASATTADLAPMTAIWVAGAGWFLLAGIGWVRTRRAGLVLGAIAAMVGSMSIATQPWGTAMALAALVGLVGVAVMIRDLVLLAVASVGTLVVLPSIVVHYFPGVLSAALTLVVAGLALVAAALYTARRRRRPVARA